MKKVENIVWGRYRRQYANVRHGKRINALKSLESEAVFFRINSVMADDYGNFLADPDVIRGTALPKRDITPARVSELLQDCIDNRLIGLYEHEGDTYGHVHGFICRQPAGGNGTRFRQVPESPWDRDEENRRKRSEGESGGIPENPGESKKLTDDPPATDTSESAAAKALDDQGVTSETIADVLSTYGAERCLAAAGRMMRYARRHRIECPNAYLRKILADGFSVPTQRKPAAINSTRDAEIKADEKLRAALHNQKKKGART